MTGKDGKARVKFKAPSALSEYRITARGVTGADTLVGQTTATLTVRKNFFVDLKVPSSLTQGDKPRFLAQVHHLGVQGTVALKLAIYAGGRDEVYPRNRRAQGRRRRGGPVRAVRGPRRRLGPADAHRHGRRADGRADDGGAVRPWGVQAFASASGTSSDGTAVFVGLPKGRTYESPEMLIVISPTLERMLIELALGRDFWILLGGGSFPDHAAARRTRRPTGPPTCWQRPRPCRICAPARSAGSPEAQRADRAHPGPRRRADRRPERGRRLAVGQLGTEQHGQSQQAAVGQRPADLGVGPLGPGRRPSSRVVAGSQGARPGHCLADAVDDQRDNSRDLDARAALLHALSTRRAASFEMANSLNRVRQSLSDTAPGVPGPDVRQPRPSRAGRRGARHPGPPAKTEPAAPGRTARCTGKVEPVGRRARRRRDDRAGLPGLRPGPAPGSRARRAIDWLLAHRFGNGWKPHKAKGPALAALALYYGKAQGAEDRYRLTVTVNDTQVGRACGAGLVGKPGDRCPAEGAQGRRSPTASASPWKGGAPSATP